MLNIQDLSKTYGMELLFEKASFQMTAGERLGLVGRNGSGKSTLFRIILGEEHQDSGTITMPKNYRIGHLAQHLHFTKPTVLEEGCLGLSPEEEYDHYKVERILFGLGFTEGDLSKPPSIFSGGFQIRLNLAKVLVSDPNLLLLDEPTNYLDIVSMRWIERFLRSWKNELILISHDRDFMDIVTTHTAAIHRCKIRKISGGTQKIYEQLAQDEEIYEKTRMNEEKKREKVEAYINRFRAQASKAAGVQSRIKMLEKSGTKEKLAQIETLDFSFHYAPTHAKRLMEIHDLSFHYKKQEPLISGFSLAVGPQVRIAIIGKNGKGKSTLLNLLAGELTPQTGIIKKHSQMNLGYFGQTNIARLDPDLTVEEEIGGANPTLGRTMVKGLCSIMMFSGDRADKTVSVLSGGEKSRVLLGKILAAPANLLFLDEPTNHLDMESIEALVEAIQRFDGALFIVTHSEMILREVATKLIVFQHGNASLFDGNYDEFLEKVGWEEEGPPKSRKVLETSKEEVVKAPSQKEIQKKRSELLAERSRVLKPLQQKTEAIEKKIAVLEAEVIAVNQQLIESSQKKQIEQFVALSKSLKEKQKEIEEQYKKLEQLTREQGEQEKKYEL
ncbi:MAG: ATP-binding cassette domain-containing protein [bacterium]|nr:ATP-binding cassette domain-containing protein [bacterium]